MNKLKLTFKEIASRITGLSIPIFGISWQPDDSDIKIAKRVINFLEDKRVLYSPYDLEVPNHCVSSILEIRKMLTDEIGKLSQKKELYNDLQLMRSACRKFLDELQQYNVDIDRPFQMSSFSGWVFYSALGELRGVIGIYISKIAVAYGIDVTGELTRIIPIVDDGQELKRLRK
jgi:hypothetical protein